MARLTRASVTVKLNSFERKGLNELARVKGISLSAAIRLGLARLLQSEKVTGFGDAERRAGYDEGVRSGLAAVQRALAVASVKSHETRP